MKFIVFIVCFSVATNFITAQTLFTYGTHAVSKKEFLEAFNKNPDSTGNRQQNLKEYLDLYINFRLKLQAAYDEKVNTNADLKAETENFKTQLAENFINKQANLTGLIHEAFVRSQKDILLQQVFVQFSSPADTAFAFAQISKAYQELKAGKKFEEISAAYSNAPEVKAVNGEIGYITAFTLPYSIENIVYSFGQGSISSIYKSKSGYHIFKNAGERPAVGRRKIQQLLFPLLPFYSASQADSVKKQADSVYNELQSGASFTSMLPLFGHNYDETVSNNSIEIKTGDYIDDFETPVYNLKSVGDISVPFRTQYGYNIIKLIEIIKVPADETNVDFETYLQNQVETTGRLQAAKNDLVNNWLASTAFKEAHYSKPDLWAYTDSALMSAGTLPASYKSIKPRMVLFEFAKQKFSVEDWINYVNTINTPPQSDSYAKAFDEYIQSSCSNYYRNHIEDFDTTIAGQIKEFNEANMLFYVMDKHVWTKAANDTTGLRAYYNMHKTNYKWQQGIAALVISTTNKIIADSIAQLIKKNPAGWRNITAAFNDIYVDSSRFEQGQLPVKQVVVLQKNFQTNVETNDEGNSFSFIHVFNTYQQQAQKSFEEAKGSVINDYQQEVEKLWLKELKKKYPVAISEAVYETLH